MEMEIEMDINIPSAAGLTQRQQSQQLRRDCERRKRITQP